MIILNILKAIENFINIFSNSEYVARAVKYVSYISEIEGVTRLSKYDSFVAPSIMVNV